MSLFDSFKKKAALKTAIDCVTEARINEGEKADALFNKAYQGFEQAIYKDLTISTALYNWGFALLHQAKTKPAEQAIGLYQEAFAKFSFCLTIDPDYLGAAIDGGVALMDLARLKQASPDDSLYHSAKRSFEKANQIQKGSASYNLACVHSLCHEEEACLAALQNAKEYGSLPSFDDIVSDADLLNVVNKLWFIAFVEALSVLEPKLALEDKSARNAANSAVKTTPETELETSPPPETSSENSATSDDEEVIAEIKAETAAEISSEAEIASENNTTNRDDVVATQTKDEIATDINVEALSTDNKNAFKSQNF